MIGRNGLKILFTSMLAFFVLVSCNNSNSEPEPTSVGVVDSSVDKVLVLGDISDDPGEVIEGTQPLADYLAAHLGDYGISEGQVRIAATAGEMSQLLMNGEVDIYFDSVYPATLISDEIGAQIILRRWRFGVDEYSTVIFASVDSNVTSVELLAGHMIAFDNPFSTSGYLMPAVHLVENGAQLVGKMSYNDPVADEEVGFVFSYDDANTLQWVLSGLVTAGATDDYNYDVAFPADVTEKLVVLARTDPVPRQVVVTRPGMDPELLTAVKEILIAMDEDEPAADALEAFQTTQFDDFPEGIAAAQNRMREMMEVVQGISIP